MFSYIQVVIKYVYVYGPPRYRSVWAGIDFMNPNENWAFRDSTVHTTIELVDSEEVCNHKLTYPKYIKSCFQ